ncbi:MAG: Abi family protein [Burkholderiaceae bacterium]
MAIFTKTAETPAALLSKLIAQGLSIPDRAVALQYITFVGHYRLKGYWLHLINPTTKQFLPNTTFDIIQSRYEFDREIRALILEAIERLEVAIRNSICNFLSLKYTPHWYLNSALFKSGRKFGYGQMLSKIEQDVGRSHEKKFIEAYNNTYDEPYLPPSWAMSECVTLGSWSKTYQMLRDSADKKAISTKFGIPQTEVFESWIHTLTVLRNMSAHHDRFIHNKLRVSPANHTSKNIKFSDNRSIYAALTVMHVLLDAIGFNNTFKQRILSLQNTYGVGMLQELGFPKNWPAGAPGW